MIKLLLPSSVIRHRLETANNSQIQLHWPKQSGCDLCRHGSCEGMWSF